MASAVPKSTNIAERVLGQFRALLRVNTAHANHGTKLRGWAKAEINDFARIDLAATYAEFKYWDYRSSLHGVYSPVTRCTWFRTSGWRRDNCEGAYSTRSHRPYVKTTGEFHNFRCVFGADRCRREIAAKYTATESSRRFRRECTYSRSSPPPLTHYRCTGGWEALN